MQSRLVYLTSLWFFRQWWVPEWEKEKAPLNMIHVLSAEWKVETQSLMPALQERRGFCCFNPVVPQQCYPSAAQCIPLLTDASPSGRLGTVSQTASTALGPLQAAKNLHFQVKGPLLKSCTPVFSATVCNEMLPRIASITLSSFMPCIRKLLCLPFIFMVLLLYVWAFVWDKKL